MRIRRASPLLLLLAPSLAAAADVPLSKEGVEVLNNDEMLALNHPPQSAKQKPLDPTEANPDAKTTSTARPYKGTEDAPVDGLDGKPHAGPWVDRKPDSAATTTSKSLPTSMKEFEKTSAKERWKLEDIPEKNDGVMDDEKRIAPKKGTTGTEGGISEKTRKEQAGAKENTPQKPKAAPPLPQSEEEHIEKGERKTAAKDAVGSKDAVTGEYVEGSKKGDGYGEAGYGMEKPKDLPEKPHNIPHPNPGVATSDLGPPVNPDGGRDKWLVDTMPDTEGKTNSRSAKPKSDSSSSPTPVTSKGDESWHEWFHSFVLSFAMIIFSEIGDKTFLVAALMAMRHARLLVFSAALAALIAMTVLSAVLGHAFPTLLPKKFTTFAAAVLFFVFGAKSLREGLAMPKDAGMGDEMREVEEELEEEEHKMRRKSHSKMSPHELESGRGRSTSLNKGGIPDSPPMSRSPSPSRRKSTGLAGLQNLLSLVLSPAWVSTFVMTFLGEWGDRSQIATIAMAAGQDYWLVTIGAIAGHACCTGMAVLGGKALAGKVSMRVVTIGGAIAFLVFGVIYLIECIAE
ncbi:GCR1-dependent translation factor 1 [Fulvia fulva]|nr:GCR1-dependent translation factor 1 [Fulvia fulva]KAK4621180.1 GCR1-dependent translation factor 1 [Fulvia fulva]WPV17287.1 GCR1-dependent translation factor 1 [Fulvia fulva]WPV31793.1 GCR1-dependent translation factor 1 [Fulvia fulva]